MPGPAAFAPAGCFADAAMGTSFIPQIGQSPGWSWTTLGCMGHWYWGFCSALALAGPPSVAAAAIGMSFMPQMGQSPG